MRVLIVEDERPLAAMLAKGLRREGFAVDAVHDGETALQRLTDTGYDTMLLDRDLPGLHGDDVCRRALALDPDCRILMLTAAGTLDDKVSGLELGADDYLAKPFDLPELVARLRALYRRAAPAAEPVLTFADLALDTNRRTVRRGDRAIHLTGKELAVLELLMRADGAVRSQEYLREKAWDAGTDPLTNAVRITISTLRRKLGDPPILHTAVKAGYRLGTDPR